MESFPPFSQPSTVHIYVIHTIVCMCVWHILLHFLKLFLNLPVFGNKGARSSSSSSVSGSVSGQDVDGQVGLHVVFIRPTVCPTNCPLRSVDPEHSTEHHQKQRYLQEYEKQEVDVAKQRPTGRHSDWQGFPPEQEAQALPFAPAFELRSCGPKSQYQHQIWLVSAPDGPC